MNIINLETVLSAQDLSLYMRTITHNTHTRTHTHARTHTHTQACHCEQSCGKMTKVCKDKPIRHQEKLFSAKLDNIKM